jgi:CHASE2 domain-containing sensor protein
MNETDDGARAILRTVAVAAVAIAAALFSLTPLATYLDGISLDKGWRILRNFGARPSADEVIIVGIDPATVNAIPEPPALWHQPLARTLARVSAAHPRAIVLDFPLPDRSFDAIHPGLDRALFTGLASAVEGGPFVAALTIDARTRAAKRIHTPFLALLGESRLGIGLLARDDDQVTRRFSLAIPTEDGAFPTLEGRLCRTLKQQCTDGLIDYSLGAPLAHVSLKSVLENQDPVVAERWFRGRIVLIGETQPYSDRVPVPVNLAGWETEERESPAIVVHAQALRTALARSAPADASNATILLLITVAALVVLVKDWKISAAWGVLATAMLLSGAVFALRNGLFIGPSPAAFAIWTAVAWRCAAAWRSRRSVPAAASNFTHPG